MLLTPKQVHKYEVQLKESVSEIKRERFEKKRVNKKKIEWATKINWVRKRMCLKKDKMKMNGKKSVSLNKSVIYKTKKKWEKEWRKRDSW